MKILRFLAATLACAISVSLASCVYVAKVEEGNITAKVESIDTVASPKAAETTIQETLTTAVGRLTDSSAPSETPLPAEYTDILETYKTGIENRWMPEQYESAGISYTAYYLTDVSAVGYALFDLDSNGTDELIVNVGGDWAMNVFTISDGELVSLLSGGERNYFYLFEEGFIMSEGSYSASAGEYVIYQLKEDKIVPLQYFVYEFEGEEEEPQFYFSTKTKDPESMSPISADSAYEMLGGYMPLEIVFDTLK